MTPRHGFAFIVGGSLLLSGILSYACNPSPEPCSAAEYAALDAVCVQAGIEAARQCAANGVEFDECAPVEVLADLCRERFEAQDRRCRQ